MTAPIAGRVGRAIVTEGNLVSTGPGEATLLTTVVSLDPIYALFDADEQTLPAYGERASAGRRASARQPRSRSRWRWPANRTSRIEGKINFLDNQLDPATGTIRGRAHLHQPEGRPDAGPVRAAAPAGHRGLRRRARRRTRAIGTDLDKRFVFVVTKTRRSSTATVTLGPIVDGLRVVRTGLAAGELVVVNGLQRVRPGMKIDPVVTEMELPRRRLAPTRRRQTCRREVRRA